MSIKARVEQIMKDNPNLLDSETYQQDIMILYLKEYTSLLPNLIGVCVSQFTTMDSVNRRVRNAQKENPSLRDKNWEKRQGKSKTFVEDNLDEKR
jgi:hypothetical protein